jgi:alkylhydroperoxidase family enzyme
VAWIRTVPETEAEGPLRRLYDEARARAGRVWAIVRLQSLNPDQLRASMALYQAVMLRRSALPRRVCELLAVVVSRANACHY